MDNPLAYCEIRLPGFWRRRQGFLFDMYAWFKLTELHNVEFGDLSKFNQETIIRDMMYCAALSWNKDQGKRIHYTQADVIGWMENLPSKDVKRLVDTFAKSKVFGKTLAEWAVSNEKKK